jgi:hypothetical protein
LAIAAAVVAFAKREDKFGMGIGPQVFVIVEGLAIVVFQHPEALDVGLQHRRWWVFVIEHGRTFAGIFKFR